MFKVFDLVFARAFHTDSPGETADSARERVSTGFASDEFGQNLSIVNNRVTTRDADRTAGPVVQSERLLCDCWGIAERLPSDCQAIAERLPNDCLL